MLTPGEKSRKLLQSLNDLVETNKQLSKKYNCKVVIGFTGPNGEKKEVVIADETNKNETNQPKKTN